MSANADLLEMLQADVCAILKNTPALATANVLADNQGDIEARVIKAFGTSTATGGKCGLILVVLLPEVTEAEANLPGPPLRVKVEIRVIESVSINRSATKGTLIRSSQAALHALGALHQQVLGSHALYAEKDPLTPVDVKPGHVSHAVTLYARANGLSGPGKPAQVEAAVEPGGGASVAATATLDPTGTNNSVVLTAVTPGADGNAISMVLSVLGSPFPVNVLVAGNQMGVTAGTATTAQDVIDAVNASPSASALVTASASGLATGLIAAVPRTFLTGGVTASESLLTLTCATSGAAIRYTEDGSYPAPAKTLYTAPFTVPEVGTVIRAAAYKTGLNPGDVTEFTITE